MNADSDSDESNHASGRDERLSKGSSSNESEQESVTKEHLSSTFSSGSASTGDRQTSTGRTQSLTDEEQNEAVESVEDITRNEGEHAGVTSDNGMHGEEEEKPPTSEEVHEDENQTASASETDRRMPSNRRRNSIRLDRDVQKKRMLEECASKAEQREHVDTNDALSEGVSEAAPGDDMAAAMMPSSSRPTATRATGCGELYAVRFARKTAATNDVAAVNPGKGEEAAKHNNPSHITVSPNGLANEALPTEEEEKMEEDVEEARPGAYATPGRAFGAYPAWGRQQRPAETRPPSTGSAETRQRMSRFQSFRSMVTSPRRFSSSSCGSNVGASGSTVEALPVTDATPIVFPDKVTTAVDLEREEQCNRKRRRFLIVMVGMIFMAVGVVVGVVLVDTIRGGSGEDSGDVCDVADPDFQLQCQCIQRISTESTVQLQDMYNKLLDILNRTAPADTLSCEFENIVLWWMANDTFYRNVTLDGATGTSSPSRLAERYVLALLHFSTEGRFWTNSENWLALADQCAWQGVFCTYPSNERLVFALDLEGNNLTGTIPSELALLTSIRVLDLNENQISGTLPTLLFKEMSSIRRINLRDNAISGTLPEVADLPKIVDDFLSSNSNVTMAELLSDPSLFDIGRQIYSMDFSNNRFTGALPNSFGVLTTLREFHADNNQLEDVLRGEFAFFFTELEAFTVSNNSLKGTIYTHIERLQDLEVLDLSNNLINGTLASQLGDLRELEVFSVSGNLITGTVPTELLNLKQLIILDLNDTDLTGTLPQGFCEELAFLEIFAVECDSTLSANCTCCMCA